MKFTVSVRSFHVPATPCTSAWPPSLPSVPTSRATRVTSDANDAELVHHRVDGVLQLENLALHVDRDLLRQVAVGHGGRHGGDVAHLAGQVAGHRVHGVGQVLPRAGHAFHVGLAAELSFGTHLAGHARHFRGERAQLVHHRVDGVLQLQDLALHVDGDLLRQVAVGHGRRHGGDVAHLARSGCRPSSSRCRSGPSTCRRRPSPSPGRRACLRCPPRGPRASLPTRTSRAGPPSC